MNEEIMQRVKKHYEYIESLGYEIVYCSAQGSMNYNLYEDSKEYHSDVDTKFIIIPNLDDLIKGTKMVSTKYDFEGEQIDVKDIRIMVDMWKKQNPSYLEILFSKYYIINPKYKEYMNKILKMRNEITSINTPLLARCISGMSKEKVFALEHEFPSIIDKIKKYGYDPKQLSSIVRLTHLIENLFIKSMTFDKAMKYNGDDIKFMMNLKKGKLSLDEARIMAKEYDRKTREIKDNIVSKYPDKDNFNNIAYNALKELSYEMMKKYIIENI